MFSCKSASIPDVLIFEPKVFDDGRGFLLEIYKRADYMAAGVPCDFVQDNWSHSRQGVLRGLHYQLQHPQAKLVTVISGAIFDVVVDLRQGSPFFGKWAGLELSAENKKQIFIPQGFAHGFCVKSTSADVLYRSSDYYDPADQYGVFWNDPGLGIAWPVSNPIVSEKDMVLPALRAVSANNLPPMP